MLNLFIVSYVGAVLNRVRGGGLHHTVEKYKSLKAFCKKYNLLAEDGSIKFVKDIHALAFAILFGYLTNMYYVVLYFAAMRLNFGPGWGGYIGAMVDKAITHNRRDVLILDKWFRSDRHPVFSGWAALTLRGLMGTAILALPFWFFSNHILVLVLCGLSMGTVYLISIELAGKLAKDRCKGWHYGEYFYGALLWGCTYYCLFPNCL